MKIDKIKQLIKLVEESQINELELTTFWGKKIRIRKYNEKEVVHSVPLIHPVPASESPSKEAVKPQNDDATKIEVKENLYEIKSPLVGTFYRAPRPDAPPFVNEGDHISQGQVLCLIEAMKIFNEIKSEVSGTVKKILVENGAPVQYGEVLFLIKLD